MQQNRELILYHFFDRLRREDGMGLDIAQYVLFLEAILRRTGLEEGEIWDADTLLFLCKSLWLTNTRYEAAFVRRFEKEVRPQLQRLRPRPAKKEEEPEKTAEQVAREKAGRQQPNSFDETGPSGEEGGSGQPEPSDEENQKKEAKYQDIMLNFAAVNGHGRSGLERKPEEAPSIDSHSFIFSEKHFPVSERKLRNYWRHLRHFASRVESEEIDVQATVEKVARQKFFSEASYQYAYAHKNRFAVLVDNEGSMVVHEAWVDKIAEIIRESVGGERFQLHYFYNYPDKFLFQDKEHTKGVPLESWFKEIGRQNTVIFIISDAGASRGEGNLQRVKLVFEFLKELRKKTPHVLWINPMPKSRWGGSPAFYISMAVKMVAATEADFADLPDIINHL